MTSRFKVTTWMAFADFFAAIAVISVCLYAAYQQPGDGKGGSSANPAGPEKPDTPPKPAPEPPSPEPNPGVIPVPEPLKRLVRKAKISLEANGVSVILDERTWSLSLPENFLFPFNRSEIEDPRRVERIANGLRAVSADWEDGFFLLIRGHADAHEQTPGTNRIISEARANTLAKHLAAKGILAPCYHVVTEGVAQYEPLVDNCVTPGPTKYSCGGQRNLKSPGLLKDNRRLELRFGLFSGSTSALKESRAFCSQGAVK